MSSMNSSYAIVMPPVVLGSDSVSELSTIHQFERNCPVDATCYMEGSAQVMDLFIIFDIIHGFTTGTIVDVSRGCSRYGIAAARLMDPYSANHSSYYARYNYLKIHRGSLDLVRLL